MIFIPLGLDSTEEGRDKLLKVDDSVSFRAIYGTSLHDRQFTSSERGV